MKQFIIVLFFFCLSNSHISGQNKKELKLTKITPADFVVSSPVVDANASAVVIADIGSSEFVGNTSGDFSLVFKHQKRILLRNRNSFDAATIHIPVYIGTSFSSEEKFEDFEATTYSLENGNVIETKLEKSAVFTEKVNRERIQKKFTFPNIKEGCIIEYKYTIKSPFYRHLRSWYFQGAYPCLWSEYRVTIPPMFSYHTIKQGYHKYAIDSAASLFKTYTITDPGDGMNSSRYFNISGEAKFAIWAVKDIPAFKSENFISTSANHVNKISFLLQSIKYSEQNVRQYLKDWFVTADELMKDPDFGLSLSEPNTWMNELNQTVFKAPDNLSKAKKIFEYVRDNYTCNDHEAYWLSQPLKKTFQTKKGNVADINLLLTAMLFNQGFDVHPVVLSTRDNGYVTESTALLSQYNYILSRVKVEDEFYLLDASRARNGFGRLPEYCYNGTGRVIDKVPVLIPLSPDSLKESKATSLFIINNESGGIEGAFTSNIGYYESSEMREKMLRIKKDDLLKEINKSFTPGIKAENLQLDSLKVVDETVSIGYDLKFDYKDEDVIYFNPMLGEAIKKNPFTSAERLYPVEMPYTSHEVFVLDMDVPKGFVIDEIPKSVRYKLNDDEGKFEYLISKSPTKVQMRCTIDINKATFLPEDYNSLRDFFSLIIKKQSEQIVFKKVK